MQAQVAASPGLLANAVAGLLRLARPHALRGVRAPQLTLRQQADALPSVDERQRRVALWMPRQQHTAPGATGLTRVELQGLRQGREVLSALASTFSGSVGSSLT